MDANLYRKEIRTQREDKQLAGALFAELLGKVTEYKDASDLIVIPDGSLHLLPFSALQDGKGYVLASHTVDVDPSATVFALLHNRVSREGSPNLSYIGVAAWTQPADTRNPILRAVSGPERSELVPLPESKSEVETIARDLPQSSTILEGADATETHFLKSSIGQHRSHPPRSARLRGSRLPRPFSPCFCARLKRNRRRTSPGARESRDAS